MFVLGSGAPGVAAEPVAGAEIDASALLMEAMSYCSFEDWIQFRPPIAGRADFAAAVADSVAVRLPSLCLSAVRRFLASARRGLDPVKRCGPKAAPRRPGSPAVPDAQPGPSSRPAGPASGRYRVSEPKHAVRRRARLTEPVRCPGLCWKAVARSRERFRACFPLSRSLVRRVAELDWSRILPRPDRAYPRLKMRKPLRRPPLGWHSETQHSSAFPKEPP